MIVKPIKEIKQGEFFVADYQGSAYKYMDSPPRDKVKQIVENGITTVENDVLLIDHYLNEHKGYAYMVTPFFNEGGRFDFKWA